MNRQQKAKKLRDQGLTYQQIGDALEVSTTTAHKDCNGEGEVTGRHNFPCACGCVRPRYKDTCQRHKGHKGVHLSDASGKLSYWV